VAGAFSFNPDTFWKVLRKYDRNGDREIELARVWHSATPHEPAV
jgi:hypothetical protein